MSSAVAEKRSLQYYAGNYGYNANRHQGPGFYSNYGGYNNANPRYQWYDEVNGVWRYYEAPSSQFVYGDRDYNDGSSTVHADRHIDAAGAEENPFASSSEADNAMKMKDLLGGSHEGYGNDGAPLHEDHSNQHADHPNGAFLQEDHSGHDHHIHTTMTPSLDGLSTFSSSSAAAPAMVRTTDVPWGSIIGASFLVQLVTLSGLALLASGLIVRRCSRRRSEDTSRREESSALQLHNPPTCATKYVRGLLLLANGVVYRQGLASSSSSQRTNATVQSPRDLVSLSRRWTHGMIPGFATGALISTVVFLLIPEALELLNSSSEDVDHSGHDHRFLQEDLDHDHSSGPAWKFGVAFLCGFLFPLLLGGCFPDHDDVRREETSATDESQEPNFQMVQDLINNSLIQKDSDSEEAGTDDSAAVASLAHILQSDATVTVEVAEDGNSRSTDDDEHRNSSERHLAEKPLAAVVEKATRPPSVRRVGNRSLAASILLGDFLHNFCDGIFLGTAFLLCDSALGWTVVVATVYHELAQEIADFTILVTHCNFSIVKALLANFVVGFSVVIGAVLVAWMEFSRPSVGLILALSSGVYVHIGAVECVPMIDKDKIMVAFLCFVLGAVPIGLVLLNHSHC